MDSLDRVEDKQMSAYCFFGELLFAHLSSPLLSRICLDRVAEADHSFVFPGFCRDRVVYFT